VITLNRRIEGGDFGSAGSATRMLKDQLRMAGVPVDTLRRAMIASYEAEMNVVIHARRGTLWARIDGEQLDLEVIDDGPGIPDIELALREKAAEKHVTLVVEGAPGSPGDGAPGGPAGGVPTVLADRDALSIIVANLVDNAIKYTPEGGTVTLATGREGIYATVSVRDTGIGLSAEDRERVFEEFYRVRSEQTHGITGTGLGLSLVKRLVEQHQGSITVESEPGKGSTFTVRLPAEG
jgi:signal transduction histidine kinase